MVEVFFVINEKLADNLVNNAFNAVFHPCEASSGIESSAEPGSTSAIEN